MKDVESVFQKSRRASRLELTLYGAALFPRECIAPRVDDPFYTMAIIQHICCYKCVHLLIEMCLTPTEVASKFTR
jgi:hypothetical protein